MKIGKPIAETEIQSGAERWKDLLAAIDKLEIGMALPVECQDRKEAQSIQSFVFQRNIRAVQRLSVRRRLNTVFISKVR